MNILYIGSSGALSLLPFKQLVCSSHSIVAVGVHKPAVFHEKIIALHDEPLAFAALQQQIPVIDLSQPVAITVRQCQALSVELILMSCYGRRLPAALTTLPSHGCFNMHPSLLPAFRGPEPIFWQMKQAAQPGVSWHRVVHDFDAGDIVAQQKLEMDDGAGYPAINQLLADAGARLLPDLLNRLLTGRLAGRPQNPGQVSSFPYPAAEDFEVSNTWPAQRLYNFMRATEIFASPYRCRLDDHDYQLDKALAYANDASLVTVKVQGDRLYIPCNEGVLTATFTAKL